MYRKQKTDEKIYRQIGNEACGSLTAFKRIARV